MADILAALGQLEKEDKKAQIIREVAKPKKKKLQSSFVSEGARQTRPRSRPPPLDGDLLHPDTPTQATGSERSPSVAGSARRISFAEPDRPTDVRRIWIPTTRDSLASGFEYDPRINKYSLNKEGLKKSGWEQFNAEILQAAGISKSIVWPIQKKSVIKKLSKDLVYPSSEINNVLRNWNRLFKKLGFTVALEPPTRKGEDENCAERNGDSQEDIERASKNSKRFRLIVTPTSDNPEYSAYSRGSSLRGSVSGEGRIIQQQLEKHADVADVE